MEIKYLFLLIGAAVAFEDKNIVEYLNDNGFTSLVSSLQTAGLEDTLKTQGPFTLFAPTDAAFAKISSTVSTLSTSQLQMILKYHLVTGFVLGPQITVAHNYTSVEGQSLTLNRGAQGITINNVSVITTADIILNNGVIHVIDTVLLPPILPTLSIPQAILRDDTRFNDLFLALLLADLITDLETSELTVFAPVDSAFAVYKDNLLSPNAPNAQAIYQEVLKYHVVPGARMANQLKDGQQLFTLHGTALNVTVGSGGVLINGAKVIDSDILATNGVIHAIDKVLVPGDISQVAQGSG